MVKESILNYLPYFWITAEVFHYILFLSGNWIFKKTFFFFLHLKDREGHGSRRWWRKKDIGIAHLLVHSPNASKSQGLTKKKSHARSSVLGLPPRQQRFQYFSRSRTWSGIPTQEWNKPRCAAKPQASCSFIPGMWFLAISSQ